MKVSSVHSIVRDFRRLLLKSFAKNPVDDEKPTKRTSPHPPQWCKPRTLTRRGHLEMGGPVPLAACRASAGIPHFPAFICVYLHD